MSLIFFNPILPVESPEVGFIELQPLPCTPAYNHKFHAFAFHSYLTFAAPLVGSAFKTQLKVCGGAFLLKQSTCLGCQLSLQRSSIVDVWQLSLRRFLSLGLHKRILNPCLLILLIHTKHKYNKMETWTDPTFSFP